MAIVIRGIVIEAANKAGSELLQHIVKFKITDGCGTGGINPGDILWARGSITPVLVKQGTPLCLTGEFGVAPAKYLEIIKAVIDINSPDGKGLLFYLSSGAIADIAGQTAAQIVKYFGNAVLDILDASPEKIENVPGINENTKHRIAASWKTHRENSNAVIEAMSLGLSAPTARRVVEHFGKSAADQLSVNPYLLSYVQGYGYLRADTFAKARGINEDSDERIRAAIWYCLNMSTSEGHTYLPQEELVKRVAKFTGSDTKRIQELSPPAEVIVAKNNNVYIKRLYDDERYVSGRISTMAFEKPGWSLSEAVIDRISNNTEILSAEQRDALSEVLTGPRISAIMGLPGTGKTTIIKALITVMKHARLRCLLAAPTGKAANRITEQTGHPASTIHRILGYTRAGATMYSETNHLPTDCLIIDEASMIDITLMRQILSALSPEAALILVGDADQLPSVGPGSVFREIRSKGLCNIVFLRNIHRQAERSQIVRLAHAIHAGTVPFDIFGGAECVFIQEEDTAKIQTAIGKIITDGTGYKPEQIQILSPMKKGVIGTQQLNTVLKAKTRPYNIDLIKNMGYALQPKTAKPAATFDLGDRVIQKINNYKKSVYNGEIGYVVRRDVAEDAKNETITVLFDGGRTVQYEEYETFQLDLAYALTVHKGQGSEYKCVIIPVHTSHYIMLSRSLLYTAVTRAREKIILIGSLKAAAMASRNNKQETRYANL